MQRFRLIAVGLACLVSGAMAHAALVQKPRLVFAVDQIREKEAREAATALLEGAWALAENGSWERLAVGRAWYLGGDKAKGQQIFDAVTNDKKVESSDWFRLGRIYAEAGEWDKAKTAFDKSLALSPKDDSGMIEYGAWANLNKERAKAEELFDRAMKRNPREFWHWVNAAGSFLGVPPQ